MSRWTDPPIYFLIFPIRLLVIGYCRLMCAFFGHRLINGIRARPPNYDEEQLTYCKDCNYERTP